MDAHSDNTSKKLAVTYTATNGTQNTDEIFVHFTDVEWQPTNNMPIEPMSKAFEAKIGSAQQLSIYPNPASHSVQVVISNFSGAASIEIYDINGRLVKEFNTQEAETTIDVSTFANGVYIIKVKAEGEIFTQKLSVIH